MSSLYHRVFIIGEIGVNHNGNIETAKKMIDVARNASCDAVKFQTFNAEESISRFASKAEYQQATTGDKESQLEMVKKLRLDINAHKELINYSKKRDILFLSSPFDLDSIELLNKLGLEMFKIPSGEITNLPYLRKIGSLRKKIIMSTGMANLKEIKDALDILKKAGTKKEDITVLHCNTAYPTPMEDVNLLAMLTIRDAFKVKVGYSDHTLGIEVAIAAVALGASVIEKHFTLDRNLPGPDHRASLNPNELKLMVESVRNVEKVLGSNAKKPSNSEFKNKSIVRKSIIAARDIKKGEVFTEENITAKRPGTGISPMVWGNIIGKVANRDFNEDELIEL